METRVTIRWGVSKNARRVLAKLAGTLDPRQMPNLPNFPGVGLIPQIGDCLRWEVLGDEHQFLVVDRGFKFLADGSIEVFLGVDVSRPAP